MNSNWFHATDSMQLKLTNETRPNETRPPQLFRCAVVVAADDGASKLVRLQNWCHATQLYEPNEGIISFRESCMAPIPLANEGHTKHSLKIGSIVRHKNKNG